MSRHEVADELEAYVLQIEGAEQSEEGDKKQG